MVAYLHVLDPTKGGSGHLTLSGAANAIATADDAGGRTP
jgi:hypothetical protein